MPNDQALLNDIKNLHESFYRYFDRSRAEAILRNYEQDHDSSSHGEWDFLGSGSFCSAYRINLSRNSYYYHVLSIAHTQLNSNFEAERLLKQWLQRMKALSKLTKEAIPLIPPISSIVSKQSVAWLSPYAEGAQELAKPHWFPLSEQITKMQNMLYKKGLVIEDHIQIRTWQGIPFIHDLSDLLKVPSKSHTPF